MYIQDAYWEVSAEGHTGCTEASNGYDAYAAASALVEAGHEPRIIHHGSSGHGRRVSWADLSADYGPSLGAAL